MNFWFYTRSKSSVSRGRSHVIFYIIINEEFYFEEHCNFYEKNVSLHERVVVNALHWSKRNQIADAHLDADPLVDLYSHGVGGVPFWQKVVK